MKNDISRWIDIMAKNKSHPCQQVNCSHPTFQNFHGMSYPGSIEDINSQQNICHTREILITAVVGECGSP
jgi:hypothetical protein